MTRRISALAGAVACAVVYAAPAAASTAHASKATQRCAKVSASSVSSIIGYKGPAAVGETINEKGTKANDDIAFSVLNCSFGAVTSIADLKKSVSVSTETLSHSVTPAELKKLVAKAHKAIGGNVKIVPYPSLGNEAYLTTYSEDGLTIASLAVGSGTKVFGATVQTSALTSKLASLIKLAEKL
jgi:hypothetical protein